MRHRDALSNRLSLIDLDRDVYLTQTCVIAEFVQKQLCFLVCVSPSFVPIFAG